MTPLGHSFFIARPEVAAREVGDGAVLVNLNSGGCFELNRVGAEIWRLLQQKTTIIDICEGLAGRYPVPPDVLATDARDLINALVRAGLVEVSAAP
jgi:Coenzyme PQQ synthesis protein D (PqqD)